MLTRTRPGADGPQDSPAALLRTAGQDAAIVGVILTAVLIGVMVRLLAGPALNPLGVPVLLALVATFSVAASYAVRARLTILRALGEIRIRIGAPLDTTVPWQPLGSDAEIPEQDLHRELRRLVSAAHRCHGLALSALAWTLATVLLLAGWLLL